MIPFLEDARRVHAFGLCLCTKTCDQEEADAAQIVLCRARIRRWAYPRKSINTRHGSYALKHDVENSIHAHAQSDRRDRRLSSPCFYVTNGAFIVAYSVVPCSASSLNAFFNMGFRKEPLPIVEVEA